MVKDTSIWTWNEPMTPRFPLFHAINNLFFGVTQVFSLLCGFFPLRNALQRETLESHLVLKPILTFLLNLQHSYCAADSTSIMTYVISDN